MLTVEDDGIAIAHGSRRDDRLVLPLDCRLEIARAAGATRCSVTFSPPFPRPPAPA